MPTTINNFYDVCNRTKEMENLQQEDKDIEQLFFYTLPKCRDDVRGACDNRDATYVALKMAHKDVSKEIEVMKGCGQCLHDI